MINRSEFRPRIFALGSVIQQQKWVKKSLTWKFLFLTHWSKSLLDKTTLPFFCYCCLSDMEKWLSFFLDDYLREREINHQYFRLLLLPFPIWQLAQPAKELAKPAAEIVHVPQCQDDNRLLFFSIQSQNISVVQVCCQPSLQPSNHITRSSWKNGLIPLSYNDNCDDNVIPKMKKNRKKRGEKQKNQSRQ